MFRLFNLGGPSITGVSVRVENLHLSGRVFALLILGTEIIRMVSDDWWVDGGAKSFAIGCCVFRFFGPK